MSKSSLRTILTLTNFLILAACTENVGSTGTSSSEKISTKSEANASPEMYTSLTRKDLNTFGGSTYFIEENPSQFQISFVGCDGGYSDVTQSLESLPPRAKPDMTDAGDYDSDWKNLANEDDKMPLISSTLTKNRITIGKGNSGNVPKYVCLYKAERSDLASPIYFELVTTNHKIAGFDDYGFSAEKNQPEQDIRNIENNAVLKHLFAAELDAPLSIGVLLKTTEAYRDAVKSETDILTARVELINEKMKIQLNKHIEEMNRYLKVLEENVTQIRGATYATPAEWGISENRYYDDGTIKNEFMKMGNQETSDKMTQELANKRKGKISEAERYFTRQLTGEGSEAFNVGKNLDEFKEFIVDQVKDGRQARFYLKYQPYSGGDTIMLKSAIRENPDGFVKVFVPKNQEVIPRVAFAEERAGITEGKQVTSEALLALAKDPKLVYSRGIYRKMGVDADVLNAPKFISKLRYYGVGIGVTAALWVATDIAVDFFMSTSPDDTKPQGVFDADMTKTFYTGVTPEEAQRLRTLSAFASEDIQPSVTTIHSKSSIGQTITISPLSTEGDRQIALDINAAVVTSPWSRPDSMTGKDPYLGCIKSVPCVNGLENHPFDAVVRVTFDDKLLEATAPVDNALQLLAFKGAGLSLDVGELPAPELSYFSVSKDGMMAQKSIKAATDSIDSIYIRGGESITFNVTIPKPDTYTDEQAKTQRLTAEIINDAEPGTESVPLLAYKTDALNDMFNESTPSYYDESGIEHAGKCDFDVIVTKFTCDVNTPLGQACPLTISMPEKSTCGKHSVKLLIGETRSKILWLPIRMNYDNLDIQPNKVPMTHGSRKQFTFTIKNNGDADYASLGVNDAPLGAKMTANSCSSLTKGANCSISYNFAGVNVGNYKFKLVGTRMDGTSSQADQSEIGLSVSMGY